MRKLTPLISAIGALVGLIGLTMAHGLASAQKSLTVAAYPAVDEIVRAAMQHWKKLHSTVEIKVVSRQFSDHPAAMTTALSTSVYLPDVIALEVGCLGRFAQGIVEQIGAPLALYKRPVNRFEATFLGAPRISLLPRPAAGAPAPQKNLWMALAGSALASTQVVGLRPEHVRVLAAGRLLT